MQNFFTHILYDITMEETVTIISAYQVLPDLTFQVWPHLAPFSPLYFTGKAKELEGAVLQVPHLFEGTVLFVHVQVVYGVI